MKNKNIFGKKIKHIRASKNMTQKAFAKFLGISLVSVERYEVGAHLPDYRALKIIFTKFPEYILDLTIDDISVKQTKIEEKNKERICQSKK